MAKNQDRQAQAMQYMQLLQSGVPAADAFKQAYPNGIPTQAQELAQQSKDKQNSALMGTGGTIAGLLGVRYAPEIYAKGKAALGFGTDAASTTAPVTTNVGSTLAGGGGGAAASGAYPVGTAANGATLMSDGTSVASTALEAPTGLSVSTVPATSSPMAGTTSGLAGQIGGSLLAAKGAYDTIGGWQNGGKGMRSGLTEMGGGAGLAFGGPIGGAIGAVGGNVLGYGLQGNGIKNDLALAALGPIGWTVLGAKKAGLLKPHKTTRQTAQEHSQQLLEDAGDDQVAQNYVQGARQGFDAAPVGPAFNGGQFATFDEYKKAGLDPKDLSGVYGNMKTFGTSAWANLTQDQRESVTQGLIGADLYKSKKGEVEITDTDKAKQIYATILAQSQPKQTMRNAPAVVNPELASKQIAQTGAFGNQLLQALSNSKKK